jgi:hypothetical protein
VPLFLCKMNGTRSTKSTMTATVLVFSSFTLTSLKVEIADDYP